MDILDTTEDFGTPIKATLAGCLKDSSSPRRPVDRFASTIMGRTFGLLLAASALLVAVAPPASAGVSGLARQSSSFDGIAKIRQGKRTLTPFAYIRFCVTNPADCLPSQAATLQWDKATRTAVASANSQVNRRMHPRNDATEAWSAGGNSGDCEDFALTKRRDLLALGIPGSALRMAVALTPSGEGHAVLIVSSSEGDVVLDNRNDRLLASDKTDLFWKKIASAENPKVWFKVY